MENASIGANFLLDPPANINDKVAFSKQYFDAVMDMSGVQGNASSLSGVPVCRLRKKVTYRVRHADTAVRGGVAGIVAFLLN